MNTVRLLCRSALLLSVTACAAQTTVDPYRDEAYVFEKLDTTIRIKADGTGERLNHVVLRVQSEGTARQFSVLALAYASANETGTIDFVRVHKKDGTTVETPTAEAIEMPSEVTREAPVYSDIREKHLPVRSLSVGDTLEYQFHVTRTKAEAPNQSWGMDHFAVNAGVVLSQTLTLQAPSGMYLQVWSPKHPASPITKDGVSTWTWTSSQLKASAKDESGKMTAADVKDPDENAEGQKLPSVAWTTFHTWADVGDWYRGLALQRAEPDAAIRAKAEDLTKDAKTPEEQVQAIYRYVAMGTRYVGISLGVGRYQPHAAADVLSYQYGDCKDKDTLLESLMKAKGFTTAPALIGAGIAAVPDLPTPAVFNHVITTVQLPGADGRIWMDSTAEVAPFRVLLPQLRDVNALLVPASAPASLVKTPADPPFPYREVFSGKAVIEPNGTLKGHLDYTAHSDNEVSFRLMLRQVSPAQWDQAMQYVSSAMGFGGKISNSDLRQDDPSGPVHLRWDYQREEYGDWKNANILPLFPSLEMASIDAEKRPEHDIDLGAPRTVEAHTEITLPEGYRVNLPDAIHVTRPYLTFDKTYHFRDGKVFCDRTVVIKQAKLSRDQWKDYLAVAKEADWQNENYIHVVAPLKSVDGKAAERAPAVAADTSLTLDELLDNANAAFMHRDWPTVKANVAAAKAKSPDGRRVHMWQAIVAVQDRDWDVAIEEYRKELRIYPDSNSYPILQLASLLTYRKRGREAVEMLKGFESRDDAQIESALLVAQQQMGDKAAALATLATYLQRHPDDMNFRSAQADLLRRMDRRTEAITSARMVLDASDDPNLLNNNAYLLAELKEDLPYAEAKSRKSIDLFAKQTGTIAIDEANSRSFALTSNMVAAWDTLGDILMLEGHPADAIPYLYAAWLNSPDIVKGDHLAAALEAAGRKSEARWIDGLAEKVEHPNKEAAEWKSMQDRDKRLKDSGVKPASGTAYVPDLQAMRTHKLDHKEPLDGGATVRVLIAGAGIEAVTVVGGKNDLNPVAQRAVGMKLDGIVPPGSPAHVLRDAVLYCGKGQATCDFVFMPGSGIAQEELPQ